MSESIFVAGATGVVGRVLVRLLVEAGYSVYGSTRRVERAKMLQELGVVAVVVDVFDRPQLKAELARIRPDCVVHQLTDLPQGLAPEQMREAIVRNARVRDEGTASLVGAALAAGCKRMIAQSIAWAYAPGTQPYVEDAPLHADAQGPRQITVGGVMALERQVLHTPSLNGTVLRYGHLYGPGTGADRPSGASPLHVDAAAFAALLAVRGGQTGVFNIAEEAAEVSSARAKAQLGWSPSLRCTSPI